MSVQPSHRPPPPRRPPTQPAINLPPVVKYLILVNVAVYLLQVVLPWRAEGWMLVHFGFIPLRYSVPGAFDWAALAGPVTHQFLHGGALHLMINMVMLAAFGSGVERAMGGRRMLVLFLACGVAGAFAHWFVYPESSIPVVGASGAISGLFGAVLRLIARHHAFGGGLRKILVVAAIWAAIAVMPVLAPGFADAVGGGEGRVAWAAHLGGFVLALVLFDLFAIGARARPRA